MGKYNDKLTIPFTDWFGLRRYYHILKQTTSIISDVYLPFVLSSQGSLQPTFLVMLCFAQSENLYLVMMRTMTVMFTMLETFTQDQGYKEPLHGSASHDEPPK